MVPAKRKTFTTRRSCDDDGVAASRGNSQTEKQLNSGTKDKHMGDRSPKSNQKKSNQKQQKTNASNQQKQQATADKQSAGKKK
jgi:hypothetical protein